MTDTFDVCVVGLGPAGLGTALRLADTSDIRMLCVDSGPEVQNRYCSILEGKPCRWARPCEMISGLGGSSLLSGGKLSLYPAGRSMATLVGGRTQTRALLNDAFHVFQEYVPVIPPIECETSISAAQRDFTASGFQFRHYASYRYTKPDLVAGYRNMFNDVKAYGHNVQLLTTVDDIVPTGDHFSVKLRTGQHTHTVSTSRLVLATGRSGGSLLSKLSSRFPGVHHLGRYDVGVRLEFPQECWREINQYHNDLKLEFGNARTFCVCTNGRLAPYRVGKMFLLEGYSEPGTATGLTNLGIVLRIHDDSPHFYHDIVKRLATISSGLPVRESLAMFLDQAPETPVDIRSSIKFWKPGRISMCYSAKLSDAIRNSVYRLSEAFLPRDQWDHVGVFAPEIDYYWPTIDVHSDFRTATDRLFMVGDATTRFRGILQAFASGLHTGSVIKKDIRNAA